MNIRNALLGLFVALTIVFASTTVYESGTRTTVTETSTATCTSTSTATVNAISQSTITTILSTGPWPIVVRDNASARLDPKTGLSLNLNLTANPNGTITISAYDRNTLDRPNNITTAAGWSVPYFSFGLVDYVVYQGYYSTTNYTEGTPLNTIGNVPTCNPTGSYFIFSPLSSKGILYAPPTAVNTLPLNATISETLSGYWIGGNSTDPQRVLVPFPVGNDYTVAAEDEWGNIVTAHFSVV